MVTQAKGLPGQQPVDLGPVGAEREGKGAFAQAEGPVVLTVPRTAHNLSESASD